MSIVEPHLGELIDRRRGGLIPVRSRAPTYAYRTNTRARDSDPANAPPEATVAGLRGRHAASRVRSSGLAALPVTIRERRSELCPDDRSPTGGLCHER